MDYKVIIVGAGPAGLSCAFELRRHGHAITIFEAGDERLVVSMVTDNLTGETLLVYRLQQTMDREEMPFNRAERSWVYRAAKHVDTTVAFGSTRDLRPAGSRSNTVGRP